MKKSLIAQSVAALIGGLGLAGAANAAVFAAEAVNGVPIADNLTVNTDGLGHINLVPYYTTQNGNDTYINIINTDTKNGKAVKVRFRAAANSDDVYDITVLMSPGDVWAAAVTKDAATGLPKLNHNDKTCTLPGNVKQTFVTSRLDPEQTAAQKAEHYGLAVRAMGMLMYLPDALGYVLYPTFLRNVHAAGGDPEAIRDPVERSLRAVSIALPALCALAYMAADDLVIWLLPSFLPGVPTVRVLCFAAGALGLGGLSAIVVMAIRPPLALVPISLASVALWVMLMTSAIRAGFGIVGGAWATLAGYVAHSAGLLWFALGGLHEGPARRAGFLLRLFVPLGIAIPLAWACNRFMVGAGQAGWVAVARLALEGQGRYESAVPVDPDSRARRFPDRCLIGEGGSRRERRCRGRGLRQRGGLHGRRRRARFDSGPGGRRHRRSGRRRQRRCDRRRSRRIRRAGHRLLNARQGSRDGSYSQNCALCDLA